MLPSLWFAYWYCETIKVYEQIRFVDAFIDFPKPLVGLVNGPAIGIGKRSLAKNSTFHQNSTFRGNYERNFCHTLAQLTFQNWQGYANMWPEIQKYSISYFATFPKMRPEYHLPKSKPPQVAQCWAWWTWFTRRTPPPSTSHSQPWRSPLKPAHPKLFQG